MEIELHSTLGDSRDVLRKQERLDRVWCFNFSLFVRDWFHEIVRQYNSVLAVDAWWFSIQQGF